ncbi:hypothetical protein ABTX35_07045 [Streptomyces sp. NPDC096080]|uniref:hypothetical protein n=1 Tax=Streptomyces sp. NPDC096080 TaxID=3156693 RepID=UPI003333526E
MSADNGRARNGAVLGAATDCPCAHGHDCSEGPPPVRRVDRTDSRERAVLMRAFSNSNSRLTEGQRALGKAGTALVRSALRVERGIRSIDRYRLAARQDPSVHLARSLGLLSAVRAEVDAEGARATPLRRPRAAPMWRRLVWPVTVAGAAFDAAFVGSVFQQVLDIDTDKLQYWLAYLPGLTVGVCLLAAGTFLARRLAQVREARAAGAAGGGSPARWRPLLLPWLFITVVLGMIATCGVVRVQMAANEIDGYLTLFHPVVVVLLLFLGVAAVATKVLSYDPEATGDAALARLTKARSKKLAKRAEAVEKALDKRMRAVDNLSKEALAALVAHAAAWFALKEAVDAEEQAVRRQVEDAATGLVEERARTGTAGTFDFPLRSTSWPLERNPRSDSGPARGVLVQQLHPPGRPETRLELLDDFRKLLLNHRPEGLERLLREALDRLDRQWGAEAGARPEEAPAEPERGPDGEAEG